eukprot:1195146-Prorocentrum_minimum.AAC.3
MTYRTEQNGVACSVGGGEVLGYAHLLGVHGCVGVLHGEGDDGHLARRLDEVVRLGVVQVDHRPLPVGVVQVPEELQLRLAVLLHGAVEVQVVPGEIGEHSHVEAGAIRAPEGQRVRGHLHRHRGAFLRGHPRVQLLQL